MVDGAELFVTASIGIAVADRPGVSTTELLRDADAAMYRAKARGRDCVEVFSPGTHDADRADAADRPTSCAAASNATRSCRTTSRSSSSTTGHLIGFEVLARWRHPDRGLLGPEQFLPMAEETGLDRRGRRGRAALRRWPSSGSGGAGCRASPTSPSRSTSAGGS